MERKKREIILTALLAIFITTIMYLLFYNYFPSKNPEKNNTGKIIKKEVKEIGVIVVSKDMAEYWFAIPVDIDNDGKKDIIVVDKAFSTDFKIGMPNFVAFQPVVYPSSHLIPGNINLPAGDTLFIATNYYNKRNN